MPNLGILVYGYDADLAESIRTSIAGGIGREIDILSAAGLRKSKVCDILDSPADHFEESRVKVVMMLGFDGELIHEAVAAFPKDPAVQRPLFCVLTEANSVWTFEYLVAHLVEERKSLAARQGSADGSERSDPA